MLNIKLIAETFNEKLIRSQISRDVNKIEGDIDEDKTERKLVQKKRIRLFTSFNSFPRRLRYSVAVGIDSN